MKFEVVTSDFILDFLRYLPLLKHITCQMRYQEIEVQYQDVNFKQQRQTYSGWIAQIIQHEIDHCCGILI